MQVKGRLSKLFFGPLLRKLCLQGACLLAAFPNKTSGEVYGSGGVLQRTNRFSRGRRGGGTISLRGLLEFGSPEWEAREEKGCCSFNCLAIPLPLLSDFSDKHLACDTMMNKTLLMNELLIYYLWSQTTSRISLLCNDLFAETVGAGPARAGMLRKSLMPAWVAMPITWRRERCSTRSSRCLTGTRARTPRRPSSSRPVPSTQAWRGCCA